MNDLVNSLNTLLADYHIFHMNVKAYYWNIKGDDFFILEEKFQNLHQEISQMIDEIAKRIVMLESQPLQTLNDYLKEAKLYQTPNINMGLECGQEIVRSLEYLNKKHKDIYQISMDNSDIVSADIMVKYTKKSEEWIRLYRSFMSQL